ncbi:helix-turn-helix transcriptional regulator [Plantactinospora sp. KLBMP9567]|uniref:helix-turn-helix domain-containing protein n=1 Tax=Plantactinospora sp. KLBMP9567 TaxID=3085900 RepID=UPI002980C648|nr:helix-turn-helix transcriptional regulator [Plantactinospora sp. KLBMP9567]MDW5325355.1 helix-turn-helix transcriptional regulator [Plantactinospora sp. KLBMP9567]
MSAATDDRARLAAQLRELREDAGLSTTRLAGLLGWSQSKVSKIENRRTKPSVADVRAWVAATDAPTEIASELVNIAESIQVAAIIWDSTLAGGRAEHQRTIARLLADATQMRVFQNSAVPGLLQTAEYARSVLALADVFEIGDTARAAAARIERQAALYETGRRYEFLISEAALRFSPVTSDSLAAQYDKILSVSTLSSVNVAILRTGARPSAVHAHPFVVYTMPDDTTFATIETYTRELTLTDPEEITVYQRVYDNLLADAVTGDQARSFLTDLRSEAVGSM